jgi:nicotinamidase-related amidase
MASIDKFNDHCWKDVVPEADLELYAGWRRETFVGPRPALLAIDLYDLVYRGGPQSPNELVARYPNSCGVFAHRAVAPTKRLVAAARRAGIPIFYCTQETRPQNRLFSHLSLLGIQSLIVCGESTSGCVRASAVDGYSSGFHVSLVEECTFDRAELTHKVNLFDLHHKYVDVMHLDEVVAHLDAMQMDQAAE